MCPRLCNANSKAKWFFVFVLCVCVFSLVVSCCFLTSRPLSPKSLKVRDGVQDILII